MYAARGSDARNDADGRFSADGLFVGLFFGDNIAFRVVLPNDLLLRCLGRRLALARVVLLGLLLRSVINRLRLRLAGRRQRVQKRAADDVCARADEGAFSGLAA